jgi:mono/diheme cytochrome c family protein
MSERIATTEVRQAGFCWVGQSGTKPEAMATIVSRDYRPERAQRKRKQSALWVTLCGLAIAVVPVAHAADVAEGYKLALSVCSRCHEVTTHGAGWTNAPSLAEIANRPTTTSASLEAIIETPHPKMSISAARSPSEAADLAAYILSLKQK